MSSSLIEIDYITFNNIKDQPSGDGYEVTDSDGEVYAVRYNRQSKTWDWKPISEEPPYVDHEAEMWAREDQYYNEQNPCHDMYEDSILHMDEDRVC